MSGEPRTLRVEFATEDAFRGEYAANIANGGIFVATLTRFEPREPVFVEISLGFCGERLTLNGEVVHCVAQELAATGATPGVAVQFYTPASEIRQRFESLAGPLDRVDEVATETGRRSSSRAAARVPAVVEVEGEGRVDGRTRNLSESGALVSVQGAAAPVGEAVQRAITDPHSGEELVIRGRVARHVEREDGSVSAIGVHFDEPAARKKGTAGFLKQLQASEHQRRLGGIEGAVAEIGVEHLLQMFGACAPRGTLTLMRGGDEGYIVFEDGRLREARVGMETGLPALSVLLSWREGVFEFRPSVERGSLSDDAPSLEAALLQAMALLDESRRDTTLASEEDEGDVFFGEYSDDEPAREFEPDPLPSPPARARLGVDARALAAARPGLSKSEIAVAELAAVGMTVARVLEVIPEPEASVRTALVGLVRKGIVLVRA